MEVRLMVPVGALLMIVPKLSSMDVAVQLSVPVLMTCAPKFRVREPLNVPPLNCTRLVTMAPPLKLMPPTFCTVTGVEPSSVPLPEIASVPGFQGPVPPKSTTPPPATMTALLLTVVVPVNVVVPPLNVHVPLIFNPTGMVMVAPDTAKLPAPDRVLLLAIE